MEGILIAVFVLLGMVVASFLNVCTDRLPNNESLISPASHCASCQQRLAVKDLIPVFSYLWLRGRCRYCGTSISSRLLWVEVGTGALFGYLYWHYGLTIELAVTAVYCCLFITLMIIDLERGLILNKIVYPAALVAIIISIFLPPSRLIYPGGVVPLPVSDFFPQLGIIQSALGGGIGLVLFLVIVLISRGGMGWGDVKMAALIGLVIGFPSILVVLFLAAILGGLIAGILLLFKVKKRKESIPFAPFLSLATIATLLFGGSILNWYLGLF